MIINKENILEQFAARHTYTRYIKYDQNEHNCSGHVDFFKLNNSSTSSL